MYFLISLSLTFRMVCICFLFLRVFPRFFKFHMIAVNIAAGIFMSRVLISVASE